jgi:Spy/CpxP family protein refolding chaperone
VKAILSAGVFALALAAPAAAQTSHAPGRPRAAHGRDEAFRMIDAYIVSNLQESLDLTDEQFVRVLPLVKKLQTDRRGYAQKRHEALLEMRRRLASGTATEAQIGELLSRVKAAELEEMEALRRDLGAIDAVLTPIQQAKFRVLELEVERRIRELMARIRAERRSRGRSPRPDPQEE